jgi:hypothetical protein
LTVILFLWIMSESLTLTFLVLRIGKDDRKKKIKSSTCSKSSSSISLWAVSRAEGKVVQSMLHSSMRSVTSRKIILNLFFQILLLRWNISVCNVRDGRHGSFHELVNVVRVVRLEPMISCYWLWFNRLRGVGIDFESCIIFGAAYLSFSFFSAPSLWMVGFSICGVGRQRRKKDH